MDVAPPPSPPSLALCVADQGEREVHVARRDLFRCARPARPVPVRDTLTQHEDGTGGLVRWSAPPGGCSGLMPPAVFKTIRGVPMTGPRSVRFPSIPARQVCRGCPT